MTLDEIVAAALAAYDEDDGERDTILVALMPALLGDRELLRAAITRAWTHGRGPAYAEVDDVRAEISETIATYQAERRRIDEAIALGESEPAWEDRAVARMDAIELAQRIVAAGAGDAVELAALVLASAAP